MFEHELEERCHRFALEVRKFCRALILDIANREDVRQVVRSSGSIGANYIEANETTNSLALSKSSIVMPVDLAYWFCK